MRMTGSRDGSVAGSGLEVMKSSFCSGTWTQAPWKKELRDDSAEERRTAAVRRVPKTEVKSS